MDGESKACSAGQDVARPRAEPPLYTFCKNDISTSGSPSTEAEKLL